MAARLERRIGIIAGLLVLGVLILTARLFFIQIVKGGYYADRADRQYQRPVTNAPDRGSIYFLTKDGARVTAATMRQGFVVAINPRLIKDPAETYRRLAEILPLERETFLAQASDRDDSYVEIADRVETRVADLIAAAKIEGVGAYQKRWRVYPAGTLAAHVLGFIAYDGDTRTGRYGLEKQYNEILERDPTQTFINFLGRAFAEIRGTASGRLTQTEADLVLTIEPEVQLNLEKELALVRERYAAAEVGGIVLEPTTGAVVAMAAAPNFDPGGRQSDISILTNPLVSKVYEMGSIVKPLTVAAALDAGTITADTTYVDTGRLLIDGRPIMNHDGKSHGAVSMQQVLNQSLNTGAVFAMQSLGKSKFRDYFYGYGLSEKTGIDLPSEGTGLLKNLNSPREVEYATASFGQGIAVTPIAMARALAVLANGGKLVTPYVVARFDRYNSRLSSEVTPASGRSVLKPETSAEISRMLVRVVDESLAGGKAKLEHYQVAAKTGTAQMANPAGGYYADRYLHSFFGYFPASAPRFLTFLYVVYPQGVQYASETLTQPFMNLTNFLINYYQVPPDR